MDPTFFWLLMGANLYIIFRTGVSWWKMRDEIRRAKATTQLVAAIANVTSQGSISFASSVDVIMHQISDHIQKGETEKATALTSRLISCTAEYGLVMLGSMGKLQEMITMGLVEVDKHGKIVIPTQPKSPA